VTVSCQAPCRLDFAGGWTDVEPYPSDHGGVVVNAAIALYATATVTAGQTDYSIESLDLNRTARFADPTPLARDELILLRAALQLAADAPCRLVTRSDAPPGSGLGSSGAMDVAMVAALDRAAGRSHLAPETAHRAWLLEAVVAGLPGGKQDQYSAALGGFQRLRFRGGRPEIEALSLEAAFRDWLARHLVVCYTGQSRVSGETIARVMERYRRRDAATCAALDGLTVAAERMAEALARGQVSEIGRLLTTNWRHQQALDDSMATPLMRELERTMEAAGAIGGKAAGAGAGGTMFFLVPKDPEAAATRAASLGVGILPVEWAMAGVRSC